MYGDWWRYKIVNQHSIGCIEMVTEKAFSFVVSMLLRTLSCIIQMFVVIIEEKTNFIRCSHHDPYVSNTVLFSHITQNVDDIGEQKRKHLLVPM